MHYRGSFFFFFWLSSLISVHKVPVENSDMLMSLEAALGVLCLCAVAGSASLTALGGKEDVERGFSVPKRVSYLCEANSR